MAEIKDEETAGPDEERLITIEDHSDISDGIFIGNHLDLDSRGLRQFAENLVSAQYKPANITAAGIREKIADILPEMKSYRGYQLRTLIYPATTEKELTRDNQEYLNELLDQKNLYIMKVNGKVVAVAGIRTIGQLKDGRTVFEIAKASVLKEQQGKGYYKRLIGHIENDFQQKHPESPVSRCTKSPIVKKHCKELGWRSLTTNDKSEVAQFLISEDHADKRIGNEYEIFYSDPLENKQPQSPDKTESSPVS